MAQREGTVPGPGCSLQQFRDMKTVGLVCGEEARDRNYGRPGREEAGIPCLDTGAWIPSTYMTPGCRGGPL